MRDNFLRIKSAQQVIAAVPTSRAHNSANIVARKHLFQFADAAIDTSCKVQVPIENRIGVNRAVSKLAQGLRTRLEQGALDIAGGRDDTDRIAGLERWRLDSRLGQI